MCKMWEKRGGQGARDGRTALKKAAAREAALVWSGWRQLEEDLYRSHAQNLPEKVYFPQRL